MAIILRTGVTAMGLVMANTYQMSLGRSGASKADIFEMAPAILSSIKHKKCTLKEE